eukprot:4584786-Pleurochrysis_carterae.AAC.6
MWAMLTYPTLSFSASLPSLAPRATLLLPSAMKGALSSQPPYLLREQEAGPCSRRPCSCADSLPSFRPGTEDELRTISVRTVPLRVCTHRDGGVHRGRGRRVHARPQAWGHHRRRHLQLLDQHLQAADVTGRAQTHSRAIPRTRILARARFLVYRFSVAPFTCRCLRTLTLSSRPRTCTRHCLACSRTLPDSFRKPAPPPAIVRREQDHIEVGQLQDHIE